MNTVSVFFCKHLPQLPLLSEIMRKDLKLYNQLLLILYGDRVTQRYPTVTVLECAVNCALPSF